MIAKGSPAIATTVKDASDNTVDDAHPAALGSKVHDTASLSGGTSGFSFDGTATVSYTFYTSHDCSSGDSGAGTVTVAADNGVPISNLSGALGAGSYSYRANYSGNANSQPASGDCEPFMIAKASPAITTTLKNAAGDATIP